MNKHTTYLMLLTWIFLLSGCGYAKTHQTWDGRFIPEGLGDTLPAAGQIGSTNLRYDALYINQEHLRDGFVIWYRFWSSGQVIWKTTDVVGERLPTSTDGDNFRGGRVGRYCIIGDKILIEEWASGEEMWRFITVWGHVRSDGGITFTQSQWQAGRDSEQPVRNCQSRYDCHIVGEMKRSPDW